MKTTMLLLLVAALGYLCIIPTGINARNYEKVEVNEAEEIEEFVWEEPTGKQPKIQVAILLDVSGSMSGLIEQAKSQVWSMVNELTMSHFDNETPEIEIGLYAYANGNTWSNYITAVSPLTTDLDRISEALFALSINGSSEYCGAVIKTSLDDLEWSKNKNDLRVIFIAGNEEFTQGPIAYQSACKGAMKRNIIVNTIFCGDYQNGIEIKWKDGADLAEGKYMNIDHNEAIVHIDAPQDKEIQSLNLELNNTYIYYGTKGQEMKERQNAQDGNALQYGRANYVKRAAVKASSNYLNTSWDLVDAFNTSSLDFEQLDRQTLPNELKDKSSDELKKYIEKIDKDRKAIQERIRDLNTARTNYVKEQQSKSNNKGTLDAAIISTIREQALKKGFEFKN